MTRLQEDLDRLAVLKGRASKLAKDQKAANSEAKTFEQHVLMRMDAEGTKGLRTDENLYTYTNQNFAAVDDEDAFIRWVLENDEGVADFMERVGGASVTTIIEAISYIELLALKPRAERLNALVRNRLDDGEPMPPGISHRPADYVSIRKA